MAEIERKDLISDEALQAPLTLAKNMDVATEASMRLVASTKKIEDNINGNSGSTSKLTKETQDLAKAQTELDKIQKQYAASTQKLSDEYLSNKRALAAINQEVKTKYELGERDAKTVTAQTASLKQLEAALIANKNAYKDLGGEQARNSKAGEELLKIIKNQDAQFKAMSKSIGENRVEVGNYGLALEKINAMSGGLIDKLKGIGASFVSIITNPIVLTFTAIAAGFMAMKNAAETYYKTTLEGEDALQKEMAKTAIAVQIYESSWSKFGKFVAEQWEGAKKNFAMFVAGVTGGDIAKLSAEIIKQTEITEQIEKRRAAVSKEHMRDIVDDSRIELRVTELLEISKDKLRQKDQDRLLAAREAKRLLNEQLQGDLDLAAKDLEIQKDYVAQLSKIYGGAYDKGRSLADLNDQELLAIKVKKSELDKLAQLEIAYNKTSEAAILKRIAFNKIENAVSEEIKKDIEEAAKKKEEKEKKKQEKEKKEEEEKLKAKREWAKEEERIMNAGADALETQFAKEKVINDAKIAEEERIANAKRASASKLATHLQQLGGKARELAIIGIAIEKAQAIGQIIASTAAANAKAVEASPLTFGMPWVAINTISAGLGIASTIAGAAQAIANIPKFAKGTKSAPGGLAIVGEMGAELMKEPGQGWKLSPSTATMMNVTKGTEIIPNDKSMKALALASVSNERALANENALIQTVLTTLGKTIEKSNGRIEKAIDRSNSKLQRQGTLLYELKEANDGSKQMIRLKSLSQ